MSRAFVCTMFIAVIAVSSVTAATIHVPADTATIQGGIDMAVNGDTVLVAEGHYYERINFNGKGIFLTSEFMLDGDTLHIQNTIIDADTSVLGIADTGSVVCFFSGEDSTSVIQGFTIQNGTGIIKSYNRRWGGGIYCDLSSPSINNNMITLCYADIGSGGGICCVNYSNPRISSNTINDNGSWNGHGSGIYCFNNSSPTISNNKITDNSIDYQGNGGGIACDGSSPTISNNTISGNSAGSGGGINCYYCANPTISNNMINDNFARSHGGGINCDYANPTISNNTINGNSANRSGGGINCDEASPTIINNTISGNSANWDGGGINWSDAYTNITISNNTISGNFANWNGGGICWYDEYLSSSIISNTTITGNSANIRGGGIFYSLYYSPVIVNSIFWNNSAPNGSEIYEWDTIEISYCDIGGGWPGEGNIDCNPMFCNPNDDNYYLAENSCCLGAGEDGVDIGAFGVGCSAYPYLMGDVNMYLGLWPPSIIGNDVSYLSYFFMGFTSCQPCLINGFWVSADINGDCMIMGSDVVKLARYFKGEDIISFCPDYPPAWPTSGDCPDDPPEGWPPCE